MKNGNKNTQFYSITIKVVILILLAFALYKQLFANNQLKDVGEKLKIQIQQEGIFLIIISFLLMFFNWGLEALKWKLLMDKLTPVQFTRAFKAVWTGVTLGLFTPNRIGEYGGRILYLPKKIRIKGIVASLIGSYAQILVTLLAGIIALVFFIDQKQDIEKYTYIIIAVLSAISFIILIITYYNLDLLVQLLNKVKLFNRIKPYTEVLKYYHNSEYTVYLLLSLLRYIVYTAQYLIFLRLFGVSLHGADGIIAVGVIFLVQTIIPTFAVAELFTRGSIAVIILKNFTSNDFAPIAASTCMWILNLIIPAVLGYIFIIRFNFFKNKNTK
ncbi:MAG: flippase-like domain-containing protein [Fimbriimonadaceae bacterium]|nr:flippase-like domain-containing protein [Chitinophagales bacterium]